MFYENELSFLCDVFKKSRVRVFYATRSEFEKVAASTAGDGGLGAELPHADAMRHFPHALKARTVYRLTDAFGFSYCYLCLPDTAEETVLVIGPYLAAMPNPSHILEIGETNGISPKHQRYLEEYYSAIPVLSESDRLFVMLDAFCERIWKSPSFSIVNLNEGREEPASPLQDMNRAPALDDVLVNMKAMETRYGFENEMIRAVTLGQIQMEKQLLTAFSDRMFEKRVADPLRNAKNYCIIMNTLLRKAAESGGVHPVYLDKTSSAFALKIEQMASTGENGALMCEMFRTYCRLVRKHTMKPYSLLVQKTILLIDSDLSADLSPSLLASAQGISLGYLSTVFKRETGKTVSEYIREKRMEHAAHLLGSTTLQIQTIALHCGILDVQYFSKLFKRHMGKTPKEYRETLERA
ncbi:MAG: helix-turn-helix domain-containing protein [Clostridia bacterium]|nr:helix-turn-helix domain-containing protein [Clostridia bacterium]